LIALRPALTKILEAAIKQQANELDGIIYEINKEANRAQRDAVQNPDPENIKNIYRRHWDAANARWMDAKAKKAKLDKKLEDSKFNMAMTQQDSIFPNIALPSGISTKATEYKELAQKGDRWESPVFSIGSAKESTSIPPPPKITKRSTPRSTGPTSGASNTLGASSATTGLAGNGYNSNNTGYAKEGLSTAPNGFRGEGFNPLSA